MMFRRLLLLCAVVALGMLIVPGDAAAQCDQECYHIRWGTQHLGYACIEGSDGDNCQSGQQYCYIELCFEPLVVLDNTGVPMLVVQSCPASALDAAAFGVPVVDVAVETPVELLQKEAVSSSPQTASARPVSSDASRGADPPNPSSR